MAKVFIPGNVEKNKEEIGKVFRNENSLKVEIIYSSIRNKNCSKINKRRRHNK